MLNEIDRTGNRDGSASLPAPPVRGTVFDPPVVTGPPYGWGQDPGHKDSFMDRLAPIWRFKWTVVLVTVLLAVPAIAAIWALPMFRPQYTARGEIRVKPIIPRLVFKTEDSGPIPYYDQFLRTQVAVIYSPRVLRRVIEQDEVKGTQWYQKAEKPQARTEGEHVALAWYERIWRGICELWQALRERLSKTRGTQLERLRKALEVRPRGRTEIIDVSMSTHEGADAATIINTVLDQYMAAARESSDAEEVALYRQLSDEHEKLRVEIQSHEKQVAALRKKLGTSIPEDLINQRRVRLDETRARWEDLKQQVRAAELEKQAAWRQVRGKPEAAEILHARFADAMRVLEKDIEAAQEDVSTLREKNRDPNLEEKKPATNKDGKGRPARVAEVNANPQKSGSGKEERKQATSIDPAEQPASSIKPDAVQATNAARKDKPASGQHPQEQQTTSVGGNEQPTEDPDAVKDKNEIEQKLQDAEHYLTRLQANHGDYENHQKELAALLARDEATRQATDGEATPEKGQPDFHQDPEWRRLHASLQQAELELKLKDFQDPEWQRLKQVHQQAELELAVARQRFTPPGPDGDPRSHPALHELEKRVEFAIIQEDARAKQVKSDLQERLAVLKNDLHSRQQQLEEQWKEYGASSPVQTAARTPPGFGRIVLSADYNFGLLMHADPAKAFLEALHRARLSEAQETDIKRDLQAQQAEYQTLFAKAQELDRMTQDMRYEREVFDAVRTRLEQKRMEKQVPGSIKVLARAQAPSEPSRDRQALFSAMALFGALGAGVVLAFLRDNMRQSIREPEELEQAIQPPFLETLPCISTRRNADFMNDPRLVECVRMLRTTLLQRMDPSRGNAIQVTSAGPEAGKSTLAIMLARSLARAGRSVLLVDADFRHPALAERFSVPPDPGFLGALIGSVNDVDAIVETDLPGLDLLPAGRKRRHANPEPITNGTFEGCLERWRKRYEIILFDSSPILPVADARILAQRVDGTILVAREKHCRRPEIEAAIEHLDRCGGNLLGAVLITSGRSERYGGGYSNRYGSKYYSTATEANDA